MLSTIFGIILGGASFLLALIVIIGFSEDIKKGKAKGSIAPMIIIAIIVVLLGWGSIALLTKEESKEETVKQEVVKEETDAMDKEEEVKKKVEAKAKKEADEKAKKSAEFEAYKVKTLPIVKEGIQLKNDLGAFADDMKNNPSKWYTQDSTARLNELINRTNAYSAKVNEVEALDWFGKKDFNYNNYLVYSAEDYSAFLDAYIFEWNNADPNGGAIKYYSSNNGTLTGAVDRLEIFSNEVSKMEEKLR